MRLIPGFCHRPTSGSVAAFPGLYGGIRVVVDGAVLTGYTNAETDGPIGHEPTYDAAGEEHEYPIEKFAGEHLGSTLESLYHAVEPFAIGEAERYREYTAGLVSEPGGTTLAFSALDADHVRVAALPRDHDQTLELPLDAQVGVATTPAALSTALADCVETCLAYARRAYVETDRDYDFTEDYETYTDSWDDRLATLRDV